MGGINLAEIAVQLGRDILAVRVAGEESDRLVIGADELQKELKQIEESGLPLINYFIRYPGNSAADMGIFPDE